MRGTWSTAVAAGVNGVPVGKKSENEVIAEAVRRNRVRTARKLGMHLSTLWRRVSVYGLENKSGAFRTSHPDAVRQHASRLLHSLLW